MIERYVRPLYQEILGNPLGRILGVVMTPNMITLLSVLTGIGIVPALFNDQPLLALVLLCLSGLLDTLDGTVARLFNNATPLGTALDIIGDRIVEFAVLLGLFLVSPETRSLDAILMLGSVLICVSSFLVVGILSQNDSVKGFHYSPGLMERPEAFAFFAAMILLPEYFHSLSITFTFLVCLTAVVRMLEFGRKA
jgi:phosphatidylglycerophosphate synthase